MPAGKSRCASVCEQPDQPRLVQSASAQHPELRDGFPRPHDPCGFVQYDVNFDNNDEQIVTRVDYQLNANHTIFGRYIDTFERRPPKRARPTTS